MKIKNILLRLSFVAAMLVSLASCRNDSFEEYIYPPLEPVEKATRTTLVYMVADNNLTGYAWNNINEILAGIPAAGLDAHYNNILVYIDPGSADSKDPDKGTLPRLVEFKVNSLYEPVKEVVKYYPEQNSADPSVMRSVLEEVRNGYPADEHVLMLWSHGTAWLPSPGLIVPYASPEASPFSFGPDGSSYMDVEDLVAAIPDNVYDLIIFDVCYMSSVELLYDLRNKSKYFMGAPTETLATGFPYRVMTPKLLAPQLDMVGIAEAFYNNYIMSSATIALVKSSELAPLSLVMRDIIQADVAGAKSVNLSVLQRYGRGSCDVLYDLRDYADNISTPGEMAELDEVLARAVVYKNNTPNAFGIPITRCSGLSIYVPAPSMQDRDLRYYRTLSWYKDVWE